MFIRTVDEALERCIRQRLPLPADIGDVSFDTPTGSWAAQLSRITVNLFLYDVARSSQPSRSARRQVDEEEGVRQRRRPQPMIDLGYLVSAWAGTPRDEHQLLGDVVSCLAALQDLPEEFVTGPITSNITVSMDEDSRSRVREIWTAAGGQLKASFTLRVTAAADSFGWEPEPALVTRIEALANPRPGMS